MTANMYWDLADRSLICGLQPRGQRSSHTGTIESPTDAAESYSPASARISCTYRSIPHASYSSRCSNPRSYNSTQSRQPLSSARAASRCFSASSSSANTDSRHILCASSSSSSSCCNAPTQSRNSWISLCVSVSVAVQGRVSVALDDCVRRRAVVSTSIYTCLSALLSECRNNQSRMQAQIL